MPITTLPFRAPPAEREPAEQAVERLNALQVSDDDAGRYRLAPQASDFDWLREREPRLGQDPSQLTQRRDFFDDLDFLRDELREARALDEDRERDRNRQERRETASAAPGPTVREGSCRIRLSRGSTQLPERLAPAGTEQLNGGNPKYCELISLLDAINDPWGRRCGVNAAFEALGE